VQSGYALLRPRLAHLYRAQHRVDSLLKFNLSLLWLEASQSAHAVLLYGFLLNNHSFV